MKQHFIPFTLFRFFSCLLLSLAAAGTALAQSRGTAGEAEALVKKAVAFVKANGNDKAVQEFTSGNQFKDRDLYIVAYDFQGNNLAHGFNPKFVGKNLIDLKDPDGKPLIKWMVDTAKDKGKGWVEGYRFIDPVTNKFSDRAIYVERVGDILVGCGIAKS